MHTTFDSSQRERRVPLAALKVLKGSIMAGHRLCARLILFLGGILLPETPNSLIERGHLEEGREVLKRIRGTQHIDIEYEDILLATQQGKMIADNPYVTLMKRQYRPQLLITILMPLFQQFPGINAVIFYSPIFFCMIGGVDVLRAASQSMSVPHKRMPISDKI